MPRTRHRNLRFPVLGVDRRFGFQGQRPFTTVDALNVRPDGTIEGRERGGRRPGLDTVYALHPTLGYVRMLAEVIAVSGTPDRGVWEDEFGGSVLEPHWEVASWSTPAQATVDGGSLQVRNADKPMAWLAPPLAIDSRQPYTVKLRARAMDAIGPGHDSETAHGKALIYLLLDDAPAAHFDDDTPSKGVIVELERNHPSGGNSGANNYRIEISIIDSGGVATNIQSASYLDDGPLEVVVERGFGITARFGDRESLHLTWNDALEELSASGEHVGFGLQTIDPEHELTTMFAFGFSLSYAREVLDRPLRSVLFTVGGSDPDRGIPLIESNDGTSLGGIPYPLSDPLRAPILHAAAYTQHLFIADHDGLGGEGVAPKVIRYNADDERWEMYAWEATAEGNSDEPGTPTFLLGVPRGNPIIAMWHDRILLAGAQEHPHILWLSAMGNPYDWDFSRFIDEQEPRSAWVSISMEDGSVAEPITALVPYTADYLIVGCVNSIWVMRGDIAFGGRWDNVSRTIGFVSHGGWCRTPMGDIVFLSADGLYVLSPGSSEPQSFSRERLPRAMLNVSSVSQVVSLAYDIEGRGIHIFISSRDVRPNPGRREGHWWFDWETKSFWPLDLSQEHSPLVVLERQSVDPIYQSGVFLGSRDGAIRRYRASADVDSARNSGGNGVPFKGHVIYGPIPISGNDHEDGLLTELVATVAGGSGSVQWHLFVGDTPERAARQATAGNLDLAFAQGTWIAGLNRTVRPRARGNAFCLRLQGADGENRKWAMESIDATTMKTGKQRLP